MQQAEDLVAEADHGGSLAKAEARFGRPAGGWLDLSTGVNPWPYPVPALPPEAWRRLPDSDALDALTAAARTGYGVPDEAAVVAAPGSQALIQVLPRLRRPTRVAVVGPTYAEHALCWRRGGHRVRVVTDLDEAGEAAVVVVANPNNPDGRVLAPDRLLRAAGRLATQGGLLIVDEAFADVVAEVSLAAHVGPEGLCVLRSFGKFFGLAGLRLGFALAPRSLAARLQAELGPWAVAGPALAIGRTALADRGWAAATRQRLARAAARLGQVLAAAHIPTVGGTDLFCLVETDGAHALFEHLARQGILLMVEQPVLLFWRDCGG